MSEAFWTQVLDVVKYALGGLGVILLFNGWPKFWSRCKCHCDQCKNFKTTQEKD